MLTRGSRWLVFRASRTAVAALVCVLACAIAAPLMHACHAGEDGRCCRNGFCCCRPQEAPPGPCLRAVCGCAGHDGEAAGAPDARSLPPPSAFRLLVSFLARPVAPSEAGSPDSGFPDSPDPPPRPAAPVIC